MAVWWGHPRSELILRVAANDDDSEMNTLNSLPDEVLLDGLLPFLEIPSILALAQTNVHLARVTSESVLVELELASPLTPALAASRARPHTRRRSRSDPSACERRCSRTFWRRKIRRDYNLPPSVSARVDGWKELYSALRRPSVYVWGSVHVATTHTPRR